MKNFKNNIFISAMALAMLAGTTSCGDDFLKEDSGHMVTDELLETGEGALAMAAGLYGNIRWHFGYEHAYGTTLYGTDEFTIGADNTSDPWNTYDNRLNPLDYTMALGAPNGNCPAVSGLWNEMYYGISTANLILSKADLITNESDRNTAAGEAHFLRGYNYYRLFAQYGAVTLETEAAGGVESIGKSYKRATEEETLNQIIEDFEAAYNMLPLKKWRGNGTWTRYTAAHFLAKALLYRQSERCENWNSNYPKDKDLERVITLANEVIAACPLAKDYNDLYANWTGTDCVNEGLDEILMAAEHNADSGTRGRFGNRTFSYFNPQFSNFSGGFVQRGMYIGGMDFQRCRPTEYTYSVFDNVNDARMWKTFKTIYGYNNYQKLSETLKKIGITEEQYPELGDIGIMFILNKRDDPRFADADNVQTIEYKDEDGNEKKIDYYKYGRGAIAHTYIHPETGKWVPNVFPTFLEGKYVLNTYGVSGNPATSNVFCGINKTDDGTRVEEKGADATRDVIMARTGETYLVKAEAQVRLGEYEEALATVNELRARGQWKAGEDREYYVDGTIAYKNNPTATATMGKCKDEKGNNINNMQAHQYSFIQKNTYYVSTGIERTTEASSLQIASINQLPPEDEAILAIIGASGNEERMLHFILNERTRELLGEWNRWDELSRTKTLIQRAKLFNPEAAPNVSEKHLLRPIPQGFIDALVDENGNALSQEEKDKWQNPGY